MEGKKTREEAIHILELLLNPLLPMAKEEMYTSDEYDEVLRMAIEALQEQKTGKWITKGRSLGIPESVCYTCSECGNAWWNVKGDWKFCPKCGTEMRGDEDG